MYTRAVNVSQILAIEEKFWSKVDIKDSDECWEWLGAKAGTGYGCMGVDGVLFRAHRISWMLYSEEEIPHGMLVLHKCDNKKCVNPRHLYIGNCEDNSRDIRERNPVLKESYGVTHTRFCSEEIQLIRELKDKLSQREIARTFKVSHSTIGRIWRQDKFLCKEGYYV